MEAENQIRMSRRPLRRFWLLAVWAVGSLSSLGIILPVAAAETVILRYQSQSVSVRFNDLETFAESGESPESLTTFLEQIPLESSRIRELMKREVSDLGKLLGPKDLQFFAIEYNKLIGDPLGRPRTEPLVKIFKEAFADDRQITILELLEKYDGDEVRVNLSRLDRSVEEFEHFVKRIKPILEVITLLLPELVCDCEWQPRSVQNQGKHCETPLIASTSFLPVTPVTTSDSSAIAQRSPQPKGGSTVTLLFRNGITTSDSSAIAQRLIKFPPIPGAETLTIRYGLITINFAVDDLTTFVETGEYPPIWNTYFGIAKISPEAFRALLVREITVDPIELNKRLNSSLGEYLLYQVSQVVHGRAGNSNIQVLRSSLMRSALSKNHLTFLEFLQNFPLPVVMIEGLNLKRFSRNLNREGAVGTVTIGVEDMLLELQSVAADEICNCPE